MSKRKKARAGTPVRVRVNIEFAGGASSALCLRFDSGSIEFLVIEKTEERYCFFLPGGKREKFQWQDDSGTLSDVITEPFSRTVRRETTEEALILIPKKRLFHGLKVEKNIEDENFEHHFFVTFLKEDQGFLPLHTNGVGSDVRNRLWVNAEYAVRGKLKRQPNMMRQCQIEFYQGIHLTEALGEMFEKLNRVRNHKKKHLLFEWIISHEGDEDFDRELGYLRDAVEEVRLKNQTKRSKIKARDH